MGSKAATKTEVSEKELSRWVLRQIGYFVYRGPHLQQRSQSPPGSASPWWTHTPSILSIASPVLGGGPDSSGKTRGHRNNDLRHEVVERPSAGGSLGQEAAFDLRLQFKVDIDKRASLRGWTVSSYRIGGAPVEDVA